MSVLPVYYQTSSISPEIRDVNRGASLIIDVFFSVRNKNTPLIKAMQEEIAMTMHFKTCSQQESKNTNTKAISPSRSTIQKMKPFQ